MTYWLLIHLLEAVIVIFLRFLLHFIHFLFAVMVVACIDNQIHARPGYKPYSRSWQSTHS